MRADSVNTSGDPTVGERIPPPRTFKIIYRIFLYFFLYLWRKNVRAENLKIKINLN